MVSGTCGENATWQFDNATGKLTISGTGAISDNTALGQPWADYRDKLTSVEIKEGITSIGKYAFALYTDLGPITIPNTVESIGDGAFHGCTSVADVYCNAVPAGLTWTGASTSFIADGSTRCYVSPEYYETYITRFGPESTNPVNVTFVTDVILEGCSLSLEDDIGLNALFTISDELAVAAVMGVTIPGGTEEKYTVASIEKDDDGMYSFQANVSAQQMTESIHFALYSGEKIVYETDLTVRDAADLYIEQYKDSSDPDGKKIYDLVKAMLDYGAYSQIYFGNTSTPANDGLEETDLSVVTVDTVKKYENKVTADELPAGVSFYGSTLSLKSATELVLLFDSEEELTFEYNGETLTNKNYQGHQSCRIRGISIEDMGKDITITVNGDENGVAFSPLAHCYDALAMDSTGNEALAKWQDVIRALYLYYDAAIKYAAGENVGG